MRMIPIQAESPPLRSLQVQGQTYRYHVMIKPTGAQCNLDCSYCFYLHKQDMLQQPKVPRMSSRCLSYILSNISKHKRAMKWFLVGRVVSRPYGVRVFPAGGCSCKKNMPNLISVLKMTYKPMALYWMKTGVHF